MILMKFGGTSLATGSHLREVCCRVREELHRDPILVVSAHEGVTDLLIGAARQALVGEASVRSIQDIHGGIMSELGQPRAMLDPLMSELQEILHGVSLIRELSPRTLDLIMSFGERCSCRVVARALSDAGLPATPLEAPDIGLRTDDRYGSAAPLPEAYALLQESLAQTDDIPVITGFIGRSREGYISTMGRSGSDYTASILGAALEAEEIQIWTDVDGVMSADPAIVPGAHLLQALSFEEAAEIAHYGGQVLHPASVQPGMSWAVPLLVKNSMHPRGPGTRISSDPPASPWPVAAVAHRDAMTLLRLSAPPRSHASVLLERCFNALSGCGLDFDIVGTADRTLALTVDASSREGQFAHAVQMLEEAGEVEVKKGLAQVGVIGRRLRGDMGLVSTALDVLRVLDVKVESMNQITQGITLSFLVDEQRVLSVVQALHWRFFEG